MDDVEHGRATPAPGGQPGRMPHTGLPGSDGEHLLQRRLGTADRADRFYDEQVLDHLNLRMREFVIRQEMFFLATADRHGECDSTFRAGPPGFLRVFDERTLAYPEYRGNGVHASLGNIEENPYVGILMVDFLRDRIGLHVNGRARLVEDAEMRAARPGLPVDPVPGRRAVLWVEVTVEEAYIHCAKHIPHLRKVSAAPQRAASVAGNGERRTGEPGSWVRVSGFDGVADGAGATGDTRDVDERDGAWGTDDVRRKGGDFFGVAAARRVAPAGDAAAGSAVRAAGAGHPGRFRGRAPSRSEQTDRWRQEAEQALALVRKRAEQADAPFSGWFR